MKTTNNNNNIYQNMLTMVQKAIVIIQNEAANFSQKIKTHYSGTEDDLVTSADIKAQAMYVEAIQKHFPGEGLIGEENGLNISPEKGHGYFTIDPLDGTKAFGRLQSQGSGTMIAHVNESDVVDAVCIGDINTGEIYGFGPGYKPTRTRFGIDTLMKVNTDIPLNERYVVLKDKIDKFPKTLKKTFDQFKDMEILSGSIGLLVARLWKSEVGVLVFRAGGFDTPWDNTPLIGMNKALGIVHLIFNIETEELEIIDPEIPKTVIGRKHIEILAHKDYVDEIKTWVKQNR